jgi:hypothetical protein
MHCFVGCILAQKVSLAVAKYASWRKEYNDLTDGNPSTHYDPADRDATDWGADNAKESSGKAANCYCLCEDKYGDPTRAHSPAGGK